MGIFSYKYKCPYCGYKSNRKHNFAMRICPKKPFLLSFINPHCWGLRKK
jgi:hypothetical protein